MADSTARLSLDGCIDLHAHTNKSDGSLSPEELVSHARTLSLTALAITDHDTFEGYEVARPFAEKHGLDLVQGIELNTRLNLDGSKHRALHLLAYFPNNPPGEVFLDWLNEERADRRTRNRKMAEALQARGVAITLEEVEAKGKSIAGRPHFARILVDKGYAKSYDDAFSRFIGEAAPTFVDRKSQTTETAIAKVREAGGIPVVAHPVRLGLPHSLERGVIEHLRKCGLVGLEVAHSEQGPDLQLRYSRLANEFDLLPTGGSDFHGAVKPEVQLGRGIKDNIRVPADWLSRLRAFTL